VLPFAPSLTVVIPAFNERDNLPRVLGELLAYLRGAARDFEVLIVDDGSTDGTRHAIAPEPEVRVIAHEQNQGLTATLRTGFFGAAKEFVTWVPADGQIAAAELGKILDAWDGHDLVLSTYTHRPDGWRRALMSRTLRAMLWAMTGFRDKLEGTYLMRRSMLDELHLVARTSAGSIGFEIGAKARALGRSIGTTEIACAPRMSGASKVANARNVTAYLGELWRIRRSMKDQGMR
jgi:hypothetical protein